MFGISTAVLVFLARECLALPTQGGSPSPSVAPNIVAGLGDGLNFDFSISQNPQPFTINVNPDFTAANRLKASLYRPSKSIDTPPWANGPPTTSISSIQQYYLDNYSWPDAEKRLNDQYSDTLFTTTVSAGPNYTEPVYLQFAHKRSNRSDAIPLHMMHGFPSSFLEFEYVFDTLAAPPNSSLPAFHVVTPNLPGYAFSPAPTADGFGSREAGLAFNSLMHQLGYEKYAVYCTDLGSLVGRWLLYDAKDSILSRLTSFYFVTPTPDDLQRYADNKTTSEETEFFKQLNYLNANNAGYIAIQTTKPLALAEAMTDSFIGWLAWFREYRYHASGAYEYTFEQIIDQAIVLFFQGTYGTFNAYKTWWAEGALNDTAYPSSDIPTGVMHFQSSALGRDDAIQYAPDSWIERTANVTFSRTHPAGGHFAAYETPDLFLQDTWSFFGDPSISGLEGAI